MSNNIKKYRIDNNLKMSDMAKMLDISVPNYQKRKLEALNLHYLKLIFYLSILKKV